MTLKNGFWTYKPGEELFWDKNDLDQKHTFFAYSPYSQPENGITVNGSPQTAGIPTITYTVPTDVRLQPDLAIAIPKYNIQPTKNVALQMKHALACIGFQIAGNGEQIKRISISGVSVSGTVAVDGENIKWTNLSTPTTTDFSASLNYDDGKDYYTVSGVMSSNLIASDGYLMMIPQTLNSAAKVKITFRDNSVKEINLNAHTWEPGKRITYQLNLGTNTYIEGGGTPPADALTYVGAFWKANQTGERIIRIDAGANSANHGEWTALVIWLDERWNENDGVILDKEKLNETELANRGISFSSVMNPDKFGTPEDYPLTGNATTVSGKIDATNRYIQFRIGLKSKYTPTEQHPVRYAVVLLSYSNHKKQQKIFLRQGEEADYLMSNKDPVVIDGILSSRTQCRKFSPYNLTGEELDKDVTFRGGKFTEYPTQTGAFFQWCNNGYLSQSRIRWAWNPYTDHAKASWSIFYSDYWDRHADEYETCPPGYRRPNDGSTSSNENGSNVSGSEMRQSLFLNPRTGFNSPATDITNSIYGYYADGFFDRRKIVYGASSYTKETTVAADTRDIAHIGRLFYNPITTSNHYNASIFFPAAGVRYPQTGDLIAIGYETQYWTSSTNDIDNGIGLRIWDEHASPWRIDKNTGGLIRCVKE